MGKTYKIPEDEPSIGEKIEYLRENLNPCTVDFLEQKGFMVNQPLPYNEDELTNDWVNETDEQNPIVPEEVILNDLKVWLDAVEFKKELELSEASGFVSHDEFKKSCFEKWGVVL